MLSRNLKTIFYRVEEKCKKNASSKWAISPFEEYGHLAKISAFYSVCMAWIQNGAKESINDMTLFILEHVLYVRNN